MMDERAVLATVQAGESETIEFKELWNESALETLAAFANARGGDLLVGVDDAGRVIGWSGADHDFRSISNQTADILKIQPMISLEPVEGKRVLMIRVSPSSIPVACRGRYYRRVGNTTREINPNELGRFFVAKLGIKWDGIAEAYAPDEFDPETIRRFAQMAQSRLPHLSAQEPIESVLQKLELVTEGKPTRGALLLFGKNPQQHFLMAQIHMGRFKDGITIIDDKLLKGNLFQQLDQAMQLFQQYLQVRYEMPKEMGDKSGVEALRRKEIWDYPLDALREGVLNALIHRDYFETSGDVQIRVYADRVIIANPGALPEGLTVEELKQPQHRSVLRNPLVAQTFYYARLIEKWGTGTTRMIELCRAHGLPEPEFVSERGWFQIMFLQDPYTEERLREMGLNERQMTAVRWVREKGSIRNKAFRELVGLSDEAARLDLTELVEKGVLRIKGKGRSTRYVMPKFGD